MTGITRLIQKLRTRDRRASDRRETSQMAAYFWTSAAPVKHAIKDVSPTGCYLLTEERWYPGTLVMMTLQTESDSGELEKKSIAVESKAVRWGDDGVGLMFVLPDKAEVLSDETTGMVKADKQALNKFLRHILSNDAEKNKRKAG